MSDQYAPIVDPKTGLKITRRPAIANAPVPLETNGTFSNVQLAIAVLVAARYGRKYSPLRWLPWSIGYLVALPLFGVPAACLYWNLMSRIGSNKRQQPTQALPNKNIEEYFTITDNQLKAKYNGRNKIPIQVFYDAYFDKKIELKGDMLELLEYRHDWATFEMTFELLKYVLTVLIPDVVWHSPSQDEEQVRDHYDRGDDFYEWFLGPRMIYTGGVIKDINRKETLEELQDNKLAIVCHKLELKPQDTLLDIGCGWGTLCAYAGKNFNCDVTGITLGKNQTKFGNDRLVKNGVPTDKGRILCTDYRDLDRNKKYSKIVSLEMAEHVGIRRYSAFCKQIYHQLEDDGIFVMQVSGFRPDWQYEDLIWGLFMNKYVFRGADASCALNWHIHKLEVAGFEIKSIDVLGVHYSATLHRWYENWIQNKDNVTAKYGDRWYRIWLYFLASATIASRQGSASIFQITCHKNLSGYHRIEGIPSHSSLFFNTDKEPSLVE
ncbi:hypothetical protein OIO90_002223 [Microbotryomycetes sp. JL221]|nr:hypothetical protein OIO90_002223 [Microbotryomycetes sp. JL221]